MSIHHLNLRYAYVYCVVESISLCNQFANGWLEQFLLISLWEVHMLDEVLQIIMQKYVKMKWEKKAVSGIEYESFCVQM